jgi:ABC-type uncharacterized transport system YnjBCD substrate-binding protein
MGCIIYKDAKEFAENNPNFLFYGYRKPDGGKVEGFLDALLKTLNQRTTGSEITEETLLDFIKEHNM